MTPAEHDQLRAAHRELRNQIAVLSRQADELPLPSYFDHPECCAGQGLQVVTDGMSQWCDAETMTKGPDDDTPDYLVATTDGWDDMSEDGNVHYLQCRECYTVWALPEELEWS